jgi:multidrug efflux pump subunit AcrA (membrane-fusion protein)
MKTIYLFCCLSMLMFACGQKKEEETETEAADIVSPVTVTSISQAPLTEYLELNATSTFLKNNVVKANVNGYIKQANAIVGKFVGQGQLLFTLRTKESESIGNAVNALDSSFQFSGTINVKASRAGYVTDVNHQVGDYVQDGDQLALMSDINSFVFVMNLPYELRPYVLGKKEVLLELPDGTGLRGTISSVTPIMDSASQTQNVFISVPQNNLPVNLVAKVRIEKISKTNSVSLPKAAVLSDETQSKYWVMKLIDTATAVKVPISKGIETAERVEVLSPKFTSADKFILTGNFGLPDTAKIKIVQQTVSN